MTKQTLNIVFLVMILLMSTMVVADIRQDFLDERPLIVVFQNATADGMTIDQVVMEAISALPNRAGDIVTAAILLVPALPPSACHLEIPPEEDDGVWREICEKAIVQAALSVGVDPSLVTAATAAGRFNLTLPTNDNPFELPPRIIDGYRGIGGVSSAQVPNGGTGGGGVASPS